MSVCSKKSEMGIGTLILFIAMILVAAIAAGVLIQTASSLQSKALETGKRSTIEVSTALRTLLIYGEDASVNRTIFKISHQIKNIAGGDSIKMEDTVISVDTSNMSSDLNFEYSNSSDLNDCESVSGKNFRIFYVKRGLNSVDGYIVLGDVIQICYVLPRYIGEDENLRINIVPKVGSVHSVSLMTPETMITKRVFLYP